MSVVKLRGLVLSEAKKGEADKQLTLFSLEEGKVHVYAKGARKIKSRYFSGSAQFDYSDFVLFSGGGFYSVTQIDKVAGFGGISTDYDKLLYGNLFLELVDKTTFPGEPNPEILKLLITALRALERGITDNFCIGQAFLFKYLQICGYEPVTASCAGCDSDLGAPEKHYGADGVLCSHCAARTTEAIKITDTVLHAINYILNSEINEAFSYKLDVGSKIILRRASDISLGNFNVFLKCKKFIDEISVE